MLICATAAYFVAFLAFLAFCVNLCYQPFTSLPSLLSLARKHSNLPVCNIVRNTVSKHHAASRSIMVLACFSGFFAGWFGFSQELFCFVSHFNLDIHRARTADWALLEPFPQTLGSCL